MNCQGIDDQSTVQGTVSWGCLQDITAKSLTYFCQFCHNKNILLTANTSKKKKKVKSIPNIWFKGLSYYSKLQIFSFFITELCAQDLNLSHIHHSTVLYYKVRQIYKNHCFSLIIRIICIIFYKNLITNSPNYCSWWLLCVYI